MNDPFDLRRFCDAHNHDSTYDRALRELRDGRKRSHWMWFVFPQIAGLGRSAMSRRYALSGLEEARAYLAHVNLGPRLLVCTHTLLDLDEPDAVAVVGSVDARKLQSSMTIFDLAAPDEHAFARLLGTYFDGAPDEATIQILRRGARAGTA